MSSIEGGTEARFGGRWRAGVLQYGKPYDRQVNTQAAARAWIDAWDRAWRSLDVEPLGAVYAADAVFRSHPFRESQSPLDYARGAFAEEEGDPELWWGDPVAVGDRAVVEWWAVVVENGEVTSLAGVSLLRFRSDARVIEQHDYWGSTSGRALPWEGWGT